MSEKTAQPSKTSIIAGDTLSILIVFAIVITVNVLLSQFGRFRADLTAEHLYTLSDGTKGLVKDLERPITLKYYFSKSGNQIPMGLKQYGQRIQDLLKEYKTHSGGKVILEVYDPKPDSDEEDWAAKYGIAGQMINPLGGDPFYLGLVASSGKKEAVIPFLSPQAEPQLEYLITRLISEASIEKRPKLGLVSALPVMGTPQMPFQQPRGPQQPKWAFVSELESAYEVENLQPPFSSIPEDIDTLIVVHPKNLQDEVVFALDQFVLRGGRLLVFSDAMSLAEQETSQQPNQFGFGTSSDLNKLTRAWGIEMLPSKIVVDVKATTPLQDNQGRRQDSVVYLSYNQNLINSDDTAMSGLDFILLPIAGSFSGEPKQGLTMTKLLTSSGESGTVETFGAMQPANQAIKQMARQDNMPLAIRLQGSFKTAFPDGKPAPEGGAPDPADAGKEWLKESKQNSVVILISDVDMLFDRYCVQTMRFLGQTIRQPSNDNLNLLLNLVEQVSGNEALIGLRSRGTFQRPFHVVKDLEDAAKARNREKQEELQKKAEEAQKRLNELQGMKQQEQRLTLSPEQEAEIKKFRELSFEISKQQREVDKELRRDIDALGLKLKIANIGGIPLLILIFGIIKYVVRQNRAISKN